MKPWKHLLRNEALRHALCWLAAWYIRLVWTTGRWTILGEEIPRRYWEAGQAFILSFWHGRLLMMPYCWERSTPIHMLISHHRDGRLIADTVRHFGVRAIAGSSSKGGTEALRAMRAALKAGECVGITPDGPRGPRMRAGAGVAAVARLAGVPVIPAAFAVERGRTLGSWDRFLLAWPFGRGVIVWGEPIEVARDADQDQARQHIEDALNAVTAHADRLCHRVPVDPAPHSEEVRA